MKKEAIASGKGRQIRRTDFSQAAEGLCIHAHQFEWNFSAHGCEDICSEPAPALPQMVDNSEAARNLSAVTHVVRDEDAVVDGARRCPAAIPHERIKGSDVYEK